MAAIITFREDGREHSVDTDNVADWDYDESSLCGHFTCATGRANIGYMVTTPKPPCAPLSGRWSHLTP